MCVCAGKSLCEIYRLTTSPTSYAQGPPAVGALTQTFRVDLRGGLFIMMTSPKGSLFVNHLILIFLMVLSLHHQPSWEPTSRLY